MKAVNRVLHSINEESDTFFELCGIDVKSVSPGTTRIVPPKDLMSHVQAMGEREQAVLIRVAARIDLLADPLGQQVLQDLSLNHSNNPYDNAVHLLSRNERTFRKAEEIRYVDYHRGRQRMWEGYYLSNPVPLAMDVDLSRFEAALKKTFNKNQLVVKRLSRERLDNDQEAVTVLQFMIYREGLPTHVEVLNPDGSDVELSVIHPAREYAITYEPESGVLEVYAHQKSIRSELKNTFCRQVLGQKEDLQCVEQRRVNMNFFRQRPDFTNQFGLRYGIQSAVVKELGIKVAPNEGIMTYKPKPRSRQSDAYSTLFDAGLGDLSDVQKFTMCTATVVFYCEETDEHPKETIYVRLQHPNGCSLRDLSVRERYINHDLLVGLNILQENNND